MPRLMRRVGDPKIAHNLFEAPTVLIVCHKAASLIREQVFAIWVIVILYRLTDQWMHRDAPVDPGVRFDAAFDSPAHKIHVYSFDQQHLRRAKARVHGK